MDSRVGPHPFRRRRLLIVSRGVRTDDRLLDPDRVGRVRETLDQRLLGGVRVVDLDDGRGDLLLECLVTVNNYGCATRAGEQEGKPVGVLG